MEKLIIVLLVFFYLMSRISTWKKRAAAAFLVVDLVAVFLRLVDDAFEGLAQQRHVIEVERGLVAPELGCDLSA